MSLKELIEERKKTLEKGKKCKQQNREYNRAKSEIEKKEKKIVQLENVIVAPLVPSTKQFIKKYNDAKVACAGSFSLSYVSEVSSALNARFDGIIEKYSELLKTRDDLAKELEDKKAGLKEMKRQYVKSNIELMKMSQQPSHKASNTPVNKWSSKRFLGRDNNAKHKQEHSEEKPAPEPPTIIMEEKEIESENFKVEEEVKAIQEEDRASTEGLEAVNPKKQETIIVEEEKKEPDSKANEEKMLLEALETRIKKIQCQLTASTTNTIANEQEIKLMNISGEDLECVLSFLMAYHIDQCDMPKRMDFLPEDFCRLCELLFVSDYMMLEELTVLITKRIVKKKEFEVFPAVQKLLIHLLGDLLFNKGLEDIRPDILISLICSMEICIKSETFERILRKNYVEFLNKLKTEKEDAENGNSGFLRFDEDIQDLPTSLSFVYFDSLEAESFPLVFEEVAKLLSIIKAILNYNPSDPTTYRKSFFKLPTALASLYAVQAEGLIGTLASSLCTNPSFASLHVLSLRGCRNLSKGVVIELVKTLTEVRNLDLSFLPFIDNEVLQVVGNSLPELICLQIRSCEGITDDGIVLFSEALSGYAKYKETTNTPSAHDHKSLSKLQYLNMANDRTLTDKAITAVAIHLLQNLKDLCFYGCYKVTSDGLLEMCFWKSPTLRRLNFCGCYKVSEYSSLWLSNGFPHLLIYNKVEDFGLHIDLNTEEFDYAI